MSNKVKMKVSGKTKPRDRSYLLLEMAAKQAKEFHRNGCYTDALGVCLRALRSHPWLVDAWLDAAVNCIKLERWEEAIGYATQAIARGGKSLALFDALSHAHGALGQWDKVRVYGRRALEMRDEHFGSSKNTETVIAGKMPPSPTAVSRPFNVIAFSLFGGNSKYCETAVLNVVEQEKIYPGWTCRFYIDESVPETIVERITARGGEVVYVEGKFKHWPGPMWRFLALADSSLHRVIFRDADSVVSIREADAVEEWVKSDKRFHAMRDSGAHTELLLAGLWGVVSGSLPPLESLARQFFSSPVESQHFADQFFLREYIWPYARNSLMQHDSMFGFLDSRPFPSGPMPKDFHVGYAEGSPFFTADCAFEEGSQVFWQLTVSSSVDSREEVICRYPARVVNSTVQANIPARYADLLSEGKAKINISRDA